MNRKFSVLNTYETAQPPRERGQAENCQICLTKFSLLKREHQCKRCFRAVCDSCANHKVEVYKQNFEKKAHRLCKICKGESDTIRQYIQSHGLKFKANSQTGRKWQQKIQSDPIQTDNKTKFFIDFTQDLLIELWNSFNSSVREFVGVITDGIPPKEIFKTILEVLTAIGRRTQVKIQSTPYLVFILLCYCSMDASTEIGVYLISSLKTVSISKSRSSQLLKSFGCNELERQKLEQYVDTRMRKFVSTLSINMVPFFVSECILQQMIIGLDAELICKFFCAVVYTQRQTIINKIKNKNELDWSLVRSIDFNQVRRNFNQLKMDKFVQKDRKQLKSGRQSVREGYEELLKTNQNSVILGNHNSRSLIQADIQANHTSFSESFVLKQQLTETKNRAALVEAQNKRMQEKIISYQKQLKQSEGKLMQYKQQIFNQGNFRLSVDQEKERLHLRIDSLQKEKQQLQKQIERLRDYKLQRLSVSRDDFAATRISINNPSVSDSSDLQELRKQLSLLTFTLKQKNTKIQNLSVENKRLSFQMIRTSQQFQVLTQQQKQHSKRIQEIEMQKNKLQQQNKRLMQKLQSLCQKMLDFQQSVIETSKQKFRESLENE